SLLAEKFAFADANLRSETVTGLLAIIAALLILLSDDRLAVLFISPILFGFGIGIIGSRFLLFFIKLTTHCQRGTSQSSFFLAWETGIAVGLFVGCAFLVGKPSVALLGGVAIAIVALILYNLFVHTWYVDHKNR
ncbi:MAG: MFS transporter, partial [Prevotella sp.]|nr:MFS transporter [Prevotella sp.]